jgi:hypothetical protein
VPEDDIPDAIVDVLEANTFSDAAEADGEPLTVPPYAPVGDDLAHLEPVGICERWECVGLRR